MADKAPISKDKSLNSSAGHRARLKQRFLKAGSDGLADYELLELLLFLGIPRRDVKPLAKSLISQHGSLGAVLARTPAQLQADGLGESAAVALCSVSAAAKAMLREEVMDRPVISNWQALLDYLRSVLAHVEKEHFRVLYLDRKNRLIADEAQSEGTVDHTPVYPRELAKRALDLAASAVILVHNHPSGDPKPSKADIQLTRSLRDGLKALNITVHDHLIISKSGHSSFKTLGLL